MHCGTFVITHTLYHCLREARYVPQTTFYSPLTLPLALPPPLYLPIILTYYVLSFIIILQGPMCWSCSAHSKCIRWPGSWLWCRFMLLLSLFSPFHLWTFTLTCIYPTTNIVPYYHVISTGFVRRFLAWRSSDVVPLSSVWLSRPRCMPHARATADGLFSSAPCCRIVFLGWCIRWLPPSYLTVSNISPLTKPASHSLLCCRIVSLGWCIRWLPPSYLTVSNISPLTKLASHPLWCCRIVFLGWCIRWRPPSYLTVTNISPLTKLASHPLLCCRIVSLGWCIRWLPPSYLSDCY